MAFHPIASKAQDGEVWLGLRTGHNTVSGSFAAISIETDYRLEKHFSIEGGAQYNTIGKTSVEARPAYFQDMGWGVISAEALLHYTNMLSINNFCGGAGVDISARWVFGKLGYYYRIYGGDGGRIKEPFNIFYRFGINCLPDIKDWDLKLIATNCESFELERHYQPSFIVQGWYYPKDFLGITLGVNYKPAGTFHLSSDYYQLYAKAGICYRW